MAVGRRSNGVFRIINAIFAIALGCIALACDRKSENQTDSSSGQSSGMPPAVTANQVEVLFVYGSEKQDWIDAVTPAFNSERHTLADGRLIHITTKPMGSGESKDDILAGRVQADVWSPASGLFVTLANAESQSKGGPLLKQTQNLVLSPVVIAMWKPMAEALGWPAKPIGWADIGALAAEKDAWANRGLSQFGPFKFGHTHPEYSNSGLIALLAETYAAAGKSRGLSLEDLQQPQVAATLHKIEHGVVHYGRSTGFFGKRLADFGPGYLSAAVVYENMVISSYANSAGGTPLVAIYPKEGTIWSDHPAGIVERPWVSEEKRAAGKIYLDYLRAPPQQRRALEMGFRPAEGDVGSPIDSAHGADPKQPSTILDTPSADVIAAAIQLWRREKKPSNVALVFDTSGSMNEQGKMRAAQEGAKALIQMMDPQDRLTLVPFSTEVRMGKPMEVGANRTQLLSAIDRLHADGGTNLYQAIAAADGAVMAAADGEHIDAIVVLTDGEDNGKSVTLDALLQRLSRETETGGVRIFTIGYGQSAQLDALRKIARQARGEFYTGETKNIIDVFRDVATFF
ncbi:MAG TPA: VWA domain-containing protein [Humisphaera sp.]|jgi:Ca-activated chloride channel family protein|nr:VWA domain-containing protein [Humisphaera sp.]